MISYLTNLLPRLQQFSQTLDKKELLIDQPWILMDENGNRQQYIFERDGNLIMSLNGKVQYGKWRYISAAKSLVIDRGVNEALLLNHTFVNQGACILKKDGPIGEPWILVNERVVPDLDLEKYLQSLLPPPPGRPGITGNLLTELKLEGLTLYYANPNGNYYPSVGTKVSMAQSDEPVNGIYKGLNSYVHYVIEISIVKEVYHCTPFNTNAGMLTIKYPLYETIKKGATATLESCAAPDGDYEIIGDDDYGSVIIKDGKIAKIATKDSPFLWLILGVIVFIIIIVIITSKSS